MNKTKMLQLNLKYKIEMDLIFSFFIYYFFPQKLLRQKRQKKKHRYRGKRTNAQINNIQLNSNNMDNGKHKVFLLISLLKAISSILVSERCRLILFITNKSQFFLRLLIGNMNGDLVEFLSQIWFYCTMRRPATN